jgi:twitching motility protein PilT
MNKIDAFFKLMNMHNASHLYLAAGRQPALRILGEVQFVKYKRYEEEELKGMVYEIVSRERFKTFKENGTTCFTYESPDVGRYRGHLYRQRQGLACVFKAIQKEAKTVEELGMPPAISQVASLQDGLVIVTGTRESGRTTILAAIVGEINRTRQAHIMTIEDPIEFVHTSNRSIIDQLEIGIHTPSYASGLRSALRLKPDVILVGEMSDPEVIHLAIEAAGNGHLVLACMNTFGCGKAVEALLARLRGTEQLNVYNSLLARSLKAVFSQVLFKRIDTEAYVPAVEILLANTVVRHFIIEGMADMIEERKIILKNQKQGMQTMDEAIMSLIKKGAIDAHDAYLKVSDKERFKPLLSHPPSDFTLVP